MNKKGVAVFYKRTNAFEVALNRYQRMNVHCDGVYPPFLNDLETPASVGFMHLEFIMFQDEFLDVLNDYETAVLFRAIFHKLESKNKYVDAYKEFGKLMSCAMLGKIMFRNDFEPFRDFCTNDPFIEFFIHRVPSYRPTTLDMTTEIFRYAAQYLEELG